MACCKIFASVFLVLAIVEIGHADPVGDKARVQAEESVAARRKGDAETIVKYTYPKVVEKAGGKESMIAKVQAGLDRIKSEGRTTPSIVVGEPGPAVVSGEKMFIVVPMTRTLIAAGNRTVQDGYFLGISPDNGTTWTFLDMLALAALSSRTDLETIKTLIPDFPEDFPLPPPQPAKTEPVDIQSP